MGAECGVVVTDAKYMVAVRCFSWYDTAVVLVLYLTDQHCAGFISRLFHESTQVNSWLMVMLCYMNYGTQ